MASRLAFRWMAMFPATLFIATLLVQPASARVIFVDRDSPAPIPNGSTWETAYTGIQAASTAAAEGDEIWVAEGTYRETISISKGGVGVYGGFAGTETSRDQRDPQTYVTRISVGSLRTSATAGALPITVSGFTFSNCASGIVLNSPAAEIADNVITECSGSSSGVAISIHGTVTVKNTVITGNWTGSAGTVFVYQDGDATISNCVFSENQAIQGAGVYVQGTATIADCLITNNASYSQGGGMYIGPNAIATIANNTLVGNSASNGEGAGLFVDGTATVANNIVANNDTGIGSASASLTLRNNDVYGNFDWDYKGIADPTGTDGNISADPLFVDEEDMHLQSGSPCIDTGSDGLILTGATDLDGNPRIRGPHVDIGAYETVGTVPFTVQDVGRALRIAGGLEGASADAYPLLNEVNEGASADLVDLADAIRIARKVAGLEANP